MPDKYSAVPNFTLKLNRNLLVSLLLMDKEHYFNFYYITCRAAKAFLFNWVERFRRQTCHSHHTWSNENVTRLYYSHVAADASGEWIHVEFVSLDSSRLQTRQWRKQWVTRRGFYLLWRFLALSETKWWYSSSTGVFVFSWRVKSHRLSHGPLVENRF